MNGDKMGIKKKKNIIILTVCMIAAFILYQVYFFFTITSENDSRKVIPIFEHEAIKTIHVKSESDKFINENGIIRGVLYGQMPKYRPNGKQEFTCLKTEQKIPFENVNDDYCDCEDGTDEPSTTACVNGTFFCDAQYHNKPISINSIPSGKVNDGVCDCCDGSDEWLLRPDKKLVSQSNSKHYRYYVDKCPNEC